MRAPPDRIPAPAFLTHLRWVNVKSLRMERQLGRPVLIEFWDFCRPNSLRTLPYLKAWHERYGEDGGAGGLQVIGIHSPGFPPGRGRASVTAAVARLGIEYPVLLDPDLEMWQEYENQGWPARYLFDGRGSLFDYHYGEGAYTETELAIQELLQVRREPLAPLRAEDAPDAQVAPQTEDQPGAYSGPYEAGAVWAVLDGAGAIKVNGAELAVTAPGAHLLVEHGRHTEGVLDLEMGEGVECLATCFTPGVV
ncbi:MAG TPA: DipZ protein [Solirubrobacteraceae bacterium]|nr:DipZ protein [Solirubrobacteraceae bacterium]